MHLKLPILATLVASCALAAAGQLLLRSGAAGRAELAAFANTQVLGGLALYAASTTLWVIALSKAPLAHVYPFTLLTFVLVMAGAATILGERVNALVVTGWLVIVAGLALVWAGSDSR